MKKVVYSLLISLCLLTFPTISYADGPATVYSIFGDDMDDADDHVVLIEQKKDAYQELISHFSGVWASMDKKDRTTITLSDTNDYLYLDATPVEGYYNPVSYHGKYVIHGTKEKGSIEVTFDNGDYIAFPYTLYNIDEYLIDKKFYKKQKH